MRRAAFAALALASCGEAVPDPRIECATQGAPFARECRIERSGQQVLTLRHRDGGFRRLRVENGDPVAADGAEPAQVTARTAATVEVAIGGDRYRLPAEALR
jgi:hypothetical protein